MSDRVTIPLSDLFAQARNRTARFARIVCAHLTRLVHNPLDADNATHLHVALYINSSRLSPAALKPISGRNRCVELPQRLKKIRALCVFSRHKIHVKTAQITD
jgi:hypothetical protein